MVNTLQENPCGYDAESSARINQLISRTYDELSRLTQITTPDNTITISYDAVGNPLTVGDNDSLVTFSFDGLNRTLTAATTDLGAQPAVTLTSTYDAVGNRTQLDDTAPGTTLYEYDLAGRLTKLTTPASLDILLAYDQSGRLDTITFPNGVVSDYGYDTQGRLNTLTHTLGANPSFVDFGYTYNPVGNILSIIDNVTSAQTRTFTYDALQRLRTGGTTGSPETYNYDLTGNRTTSFLSTLHTHDDANRLLEDDGFTYTYDANGNLETKTSKAVPTDVTTYTWDAQDQLIQIDFPDSTTATYAYDGLGRRIEKNVNGSTMRYVYDGEDIALEYDGTNTFVSRYSHGQQTDQPLAVQRAGVGFFYYQSDHQGSITHLTDSSGLVANSYQYDSYGRTLTLSETIPQPFTYTGREFDSESGLYYYRARYYDANTGRFLSEDPLGFNAGDQNLYNYVFNDPVNFVDPFGLCPVPPDFPPLFPDPPTPAEEALEPNPFADPIPDPVGKAGKAAKAAKSAAKGAKQATKAGNAKKLNRNQADSVARQQGSESAEAFKADVVGEKQAGNFNMAVDKTTGEIVLTPVQKGGGPNIPTGNFTK